MTELREQWGIPAAYYVHPPEIGPEQRRPVRYLVADAPWVHEWEEQLAGSENSDWAEVVCHLWQLDDEAWGHLCYSRSGLRLGVRRSAGAVLKRWPGDSRQPGTWPTPAEVMEALQRMPDPNLETSPAEVTVRIIRDGAAACNFTRRYKPSDVYLLTAQRILAVRQWQWNAMVHGGFYSWSGIIPHEPGQG